jgi:crossover junction endodeoxyribonuclease RuvC
MIIIGIDPGTATTGWGIVGYKSGAKKRKKSGRKLVGNSGKKNEVSLIDFGCILTDSKEEMGKRLLILKGSLREIIKAHQPHVIVIEKLFFGANSTSALSVGQARGVVLLTAAEFRLPVFEYTGLEVKLAVANHGRADKKAIQTAVRRHIGIRKLPKPKDQSGNPVFRFRDDAYDAVAATICHVIKSYKT